MSGVFATTPGPSLTIDYVSARTGQPHSFVVPPLNATALISTTSEQGVADIAALTVIPTNEALCNHQPVAPALPDTFDFREEFVEFTSPIINQGSCGACWAIAATQAFASRYAFYTNQRVQPLSAAYLLYCVRASFSQQQDLQYGCYGGTLVNAYWFFRRNGVVSAECVKYDSLYDWEPSNPALQQKVIAVGKEQTSNVLCPMVECPALPGTLPQQPWVFKCATAYIVAGTAKQSGGSEANIRREIWRKGPVSTGFEVRQDFVTYWKQLLEGALSGTDVVYTPAPPDEELNPLVGNHAVQLLGWGQKGPVKYWIVANSWGATNKGTSPADLTDYGNNGYFLMIRGTNAAALESNVVAGIPAVHPAMVNAIGVAGGQQEVELCDLVAYEINKDTLGKLGYQVPLMLPDAHSMYEFTLPPLLSSNSGTIRRFPRCPEDRPYRCPFVGTCVTVPSECGTGIPATGTIAPVSQLVNKPSLAVSREVSKKYLAEAMARKKQHRLAITSTGSVSGASSRTLSITTLTLASLIILLSCTLVLLLLKK